MPISEWLRRLGLEQYVAAFHEQEIDWQVLPHLTSEDLKEIGVLPVGHRRKLLAAIGALAAPAEPKPTRAPDPERRQLTVMFCDLVGSTPLAVRLDPEDLRDLIGAYHAAIADAVAPYGGFIAKYMGDGALIYFGYPAAQENDAEQAVRAALALLGKLADMPSPNGRLRARIGIATGLAVVGDLLGVGAAQEEAVVGETPNLAARLQALAEPDSIVIAESTRRQLGQLFALANLGKRELKGFDVPQAIWRVVGDNRVESRFDALRSPETPLVGRDQQVDLLLECWEQAKTGTGRIALLAGEAGIGKSRLAAVFQERIAAERHIRLRYFCLPHNESSPLSPFISQLERAADFSRDDTPEAKRRKLASLLGADVSGVEFGLIAELLSLPRDLSDPPLDFPAQRKKELLLESLLHQMEHLARQAPLLMIIEDLHWADPTSRELLDLATERIEHLPILLIATCRPEFAPGWARSPRATTLSLDRLGRSDSVAMVRSLAGEVARLSTEIIEGIVERTDGVPLFLEELTKAVLESEADREESLLAAVPPVSQAIPATLHASLLARLDRLGTAKEIAQIGAVIGREFSYELLASVAGWRQEKLNGALAALVRSTLVLCRGAPPACVYIFKHALVQEAAYGTMLRRKRQALHAKLAHVLEQQFADTIKRQPELLAHHLTEGGQTEEAIAYWGIAGRQARQHGATLEATTHYDKALRLVELLPDTHERHEQELALNVALGEALIICKGHGAPEVGSTFARARELVADLPDSPHTIAVYCGNFSFHLSERADLAAQIGQDLLRIGENRHDDNAVLVGHRLVGQAYNNLGIPKFSRPHLEAVVRLYDPERHTRINQPFVYDARLACLNFLSHTVLLSGCLDRAVELSAAAWDETQRLIDLGITAPLLPSLFNSCLFSQLCGDIPGLFRKTAQLDESARQQGITAWSMLARMFRGAGLVSTGNLDEGIADLRGGLAEYRMAGWRHMVEYFEGLLAEAYGLAGRPDDGLRLLSEPAQRVRNTGTGWYEPELHRIKGELLAANLPEQAAESINLAITVAQESGSRWAELRAAGSATRRAIRRQPADGSARNNSAAGRA